jgi:hypothetical protein
VARNADLVETVQVALRGALGPAAEEIAVDADERGVVTIRGVVEDESTRATAMDVASNTPGTARVADRLHVKPEWGTEAAPKQTEFGSRAAAQGITQDDFEKFV